MKRARPILGKRYGDQGQGFIEVHHIKPNPTLISGDITKLSDLAPACVNCHRMPHMVTCNITIDTL
ncbi:HNH endonuclease [Phenylobacterium sp.]|uniref:HNH endonuclease n=1 Tax=Phenylobacterium sp. TaxID=1871053 RepID=UPI00351F7D81